MKVKVISYLYGKTDISGDYEIPNCCTIMSFLKKLGVSWDHEALIVVNDVIVDETYELQNEDEVFLLTPIYGG